jgi:XTP/dITP diphosphohydrolase
LEGIIIDEPAGENGFGYDPIFFVPKLNKTVAQLAGEEKNAISHRGNAIRKLKPLLGEFLRRG